MKKHVIKSRMFFAIICMSIIIINLALSAGGIGRELKEKDVLFLSDEYFTCNAQDINVSPAEFIEKIDSERECQIVFADKMGFYAAVRLTDEFFAAMGLPERGYGHRDAVFVNEQYREQCYQKNGKWLININGESHEAAGFFEAKNIDEQVICYLNAEAENQQEDMQYTYVFVDAPAQKRDSIKARILEAYPNMQLSDWKGERQDTVYTREVYLYVVLFCGIVLCINCFSFAEMWVRSYERELSIRRIVGAALFENHRFLAKEYGKLFAGSMAAGGILLCLVFEVIKRCRKLVYIRGIFGEKPEIKVFLLSCGLVLLITGFVLELVYARLRKKKILAGVSA